MVKYIIYDSMNRLVWDEADKSYGKKKTDKEIYGVKMGRFKNNNTARAYAIKLSKLTGRKVYDKYYGEELEIKPRNINIENQLKRKGINWSKQQSNPFKSNLKW